MAKKSAGILLFRFINKTLEVLLVHPGGPYFIKKDMGAWSIPKGELEDDEDEFNAAIREMKEETGLIATQLHDLGFMNPDTGMASTVMQVFLAQVVDQQDAECEDSEAVAAVEAFTIEEIKKGFKQGYIEVEINGIICRVNLRDPFLAFALLQADIRGFLSRGDRSE